MKETSTGTVYLVDDDDAFRDSLKVLCESVGLGVECFDSADALLERYESGPMDGCLVLDIRMPGMSGLELQEALQQRESRLPIIFMTGHGDVPMAVRAMKSGALDFLSKPFSHQEMLDRIHRALETADERAAERQSHEQVEACFDELTPREIEVMDLVVTGLANKVVANRLGISQRTVEIHRAQVMEKMQASSLADLVRSAVILGR